MTFLEGGLDGLVHSLKRLEFGREVMNGRLAG
jgi:hypothetical protein